MYCHACGLPGLLSPKLRQLASRIGALAKGHAFGTVADLQFPVVLRGSLRVNGSRSLLAHWPRVDQLSFLRHPTSFAFGGQLCLDVRDECCRVRNQCGSLFWGQAPTVEACNGGSVICCLLIAGKLHVAP